MERIGWIPACAGMTRKLLEMIKFSHSIFALPFALGAMLVAAQSLPSPQTFFWILVCLVSARSAAMAFNRLVDANIDAKNPRTRTRHLPQGILSKKFVALFTLVCVALFFFASFQINSLTFALSPFVIFFLLFYSYTKRFTFLSHVWLGLCLSLAPLGAWVAVTGQYPWSAIPLALGVIFWVAGFDIIYATQDEAFDRKEGLHSIVSRFGIRKALWISRLFHLCSVATLVWFGLENNLGTVYFATVLLIAGALAYEQSLVKAGDLSKVGPAFFTMNGVVSMIFLVGIVIDRVN
ncbi:MAG: UbiA-like polyprenyltransferase [Deltaproteobacteria bacterium]|nr:UbiA-like polyprenyltransferase [Deltaproteobacteria bacterium]